MATARSDGPPPQLRSKAPLPPIDDRQSRDAGAREFERGLAADAAAHPKSQQQKLQERWTSAKSRKEQYRGANQAGGRRVGSLL